LDRYSLVGFAFRHLLRSVPRRGVRYVIREPNTGPGA